MALGLRRAVRPDLPERGPLPRLAPLAALAPVAVAAHLLHEPLAAFPLSVLGLVGAAFLLGEAAAAVTATLLMVASFALLMPAIAQILVGERAPLLAEQLTVPLATLLLGTYFLGLLFTTRTHKHLFNPALAAHDRRAHPLILRHPLPVLAGSVVLVAAMAETLAENLAPWGRRWASRASSWASWSSGSSRTASRSPPPGASRPTTA